MRKELMDYICSLHGYLIRLKEIHWNTNSNAEHLLCDEIMDMVRSCEDEFTESAMGLYDEKVKVGDLKPYLPNAESLKPMLKELVDETLAVRKTLNKDKESGLCSILDDIIAQANKYMYRTTQK
jgi:DNA-binding ferritin-like protein